MKTERDAIEGFKIVVNDDKSPYSKHPTDYSLWKIANYDERTGKLEALPEMERVKRAVELVELKNEN